MDVSLFNSEVQADINERIEHLSRIHTMPTRYPFRDKDKSTWKMCLSYDPMLSGKDSLLILFLYILEK